MAKYTQYFGRQLDTIDKLVYGSADKTAAIGDNREGTSVANPWPMVGRRLGQWIEHPSLKSRSEDIFKASKVSHNNFVQKILEMIDEKKGLSIDPGLPICILSNQKDTWSIHGIDFYYDKITLY